MFALCQPKESGIVFQSGQFSQVEFDFVLPLTHQFQFGGRTVWLRLAIEALDEIR